MSRFAWEPTPEQMNESNLVPFMRHVGIEATTTTRSSRGARGPGAVLGHRDPLPGPQVSGSLRAGPRHERGSRMDEVVHRGRTNAVITASSAIGDAHRGPAGHPVGGRAGGGQGVDLPGIRPGDLPARGRPSFPRARTGDAVGLYMPMIPEVTAAFFAVQHIGAVVVPLFSGFGEDAVRARLEDADAKAVLTVDATLRRGSVIPMKATLDAALAGSRPCGTWSCTNTSESRSTGTRIATAGGAR